MNPLHKFSLCVLSLILFFGCSNSEESMGILHSSRHQKGEYLYRMHHEHFLQIPPQQPSQPLPYPWEQNHAGEHIKITQEFFRCKGSSLNPVHLSEEKGEQVRYYDCGGASKHSLPLRDNKEFIYPILIDLLNYIQSKTNLRVVITSGHRCPEHNVYVDDTKQNRYSKHMIGAEVSFYVQGMESHPEAIVKLLQAYYQETKKYVGKKEYLEFQRYEKDTDVSTLPWYNKEVFVKLYKKGEGRNFDNRHCYPYLSIQVRHDYDLQEKVTYSWDKAYQIRKG